MKKILLLTILLLAGCQTANLGAGEPLKAIKTKILFSTEVNDIRCDKSNCTDLGKIVKYTYISTEEVAIKAGEDISKRTENTIFTTENGKKTAYVYVGKPFYKDGDKWYLVNTATTTVSNFNQQTKVGWLERLLGQKALAANYDTGAGDGAIRSANEAVYANARNASAGASLYDTSGYIENWYNGSTYLVDRAFFPTDTSAIPDGATIDTASLNYYTSDHNDVNGESVSLVQSTQADPTSLALDDFDQVGSTKLASDITFGSISVNGFNTMALNASGLAIVSTTGYTKLALRVTGDLNNSTPTGANYVHVHFYGSGANPYMTITYTEAPTNTCTPPAAGDWYVKAKDNCYVKTTTYVAGKCILINTDGPGALYIIDGARLSCHGIVSTSTPIKAEGGTFIDLDTD